jgi:hypothetical protein
VLRDLSHGWHAWPAASSTWCRGRALFPQLRLNPAKVICLTVSDDGFIMMIAMQQFHLHNQQLLQQQQFCCLYIQPTDSVMLQSALKFEFEWFISSRPASSRGCSWILSIAAVFSIFVDVVIISAFVSSAVWTSAAARSPVAPTLLSLPPFPAHWHGGSRF